MHIISFLIYNLKKSSLMEFLHKFIEKAESCPVVLAEMGKWLTLLKASYAEAERIFHITLKSPITELITMADGNRDGIITGIKAIVNSYLKSEDSQKREAARLLMVGLTSIKHNRNDQYVEQTGQVDNLLYFLTVQEKDSVTLLGLSDVVSSLQTINDRIHELIDVRVEELENRDIGAFANARSAAEEAFRKFVQVVNSWATLNEDRLDEGESEDESELSVAQFIKWANANIKFYDMKVLKQPASEVDKEVEDGDESGDTEPDDKKVTASFTFINGETVEVKAEAGAALVALENTEGYEWEPAVPETMPAEDTSYFEVAIPAEEEEEEEEERPKYKITFRAGGSLIAIKEYHEGDTIVPPECPEGFRWPDDMPTVMPAQNVTVRAEGLDD